MTDKEVLIKAVEHIENLVEIAYLDKEQDWKIVNEAKEFIEWLKSISYEGNEEIQNMGQQGE